MPTPVARARQCLGEEPARALNDAVSLARRRHHNQTFSLHVLACLLSPSFSFLRDTLSRCRTMDGCYPTRFRFRVLNLVICANLDKIQTSRNAHSKDFVPPVANCLMAAIKRAQASQRRQPDMCHLTQIHINNQPISISGIKVELKHFVFSIVDDPTVSRVLEMVGFENVTIKHAIMHPPIPKWVPEPGPFRCPPMFMDFPGFAEDDENCRRIGEVMMKNKEKNPILIGVCAKDALFKFKESILKGRYGGVLRETQGLKMVCMEREIEEYVRREREGFGLKIKEVSSMMENCAFGSGVIVNLGELRVLAMDQGSSSPSSSSSINFGDYDYDIVRELVMKLSGLVEVYGKRKKLWLIGAAAKYETYSKFVGMFPSMEREWDLHPLPIISSTSLGSKPSLMASFVPLGGFFPTWPELRTPMTVVNQPFNRCNACSELYEMELFSMLIEGSSVSIADKYSECLSSSLHRSNFDPMKGGGFVTQVKDVKTVSHEQILKLQKKWNDRCQRLHQILTCPAAGAPFVRPQLQQNPALQFVSDKRGAISSSGESSLNVGVCSTATTAMHTASQSSYPQQKVMMADFSKKALETSQGRTSVSEHSTSPVYPSQNLSLPLHYKPASTITVTVTTDLGLGTIYVSKSEKLKNPLLQDQREHLQHSRGSNTWNGDITSRKFPEQRAQSYFHRGPGLKEGLGPADYKLIFRKLSDVVAWQGEAISRISEIITSCRSENGHQRASHKRRDIWLTFHGPDKIGKRRVAEALADVVFGGRDCLIALDLSSQDTSSKANSLFLYQGTCDFDLNLSRITVVDHIARELSKKAHCVVFLENIDEADPLLQNSLSRAIQMGKFQDSRGREISIKNVIFIATYGMADEDKSISPRKEFIKFPEAKILEAKNWQMEVTVKTIREVASRSNTTRVSLVSARSPSVSDQGTSKRKASDISCSFEDMGVGKRVSKTPKHALDLNLPSEEAIESDSYGGDFFSDSPRAWLEDFFGQADGNVAFKPFNFDAFADKVLTKIHSKFEDTFRGGSILLEIENEVMGQILAASWCSEKQGAVEEWIEHVVGPTFSEARKRFWVTDESVVRLASCEGVPVNECASGICLPRSINLSI